MISVLKSRINHQNYSIFVWVHGKTNTLLIKIPIRVIVKYKLVLHIVFMKIKKIYYASEGNYYAFEGKFLYNYIISYYTTFTRLYILLVNCNITE